MCLHAAQAMLQPGLGRFKNVVSLPSQFQAKIVVDESINNDSSKPPTASAA